MSTALVPDEIIEPGKNVVVTGLANSQANTTTEVEINKPKRDAHGRLLKGQTANPGGRPKRVREFERMLVKEHLNLDSMRALFERLRALAMGEVVIVPVVTASGEMQLTAKLEADPAFMKLYLDRLLGPVKAKDDELPADFFADAPTEVLEFLRVRVQR